MAKEKAVLKPEFDAYLGLKREGFDFMIVALYKLMELMMEKEKFRVVIERDPEYRDVKVSYYFD